MKKKIIILSLIGILAFCLRVIPHWHDIFITQNVVWAFDTDSWYHMRLVDYLVANFPHSLTFDYYAIFPGGAVPYFRPMLSYLIAIPAYIIGLGHPSPLLVNTVGAFVPPVLGVIAVFLSFWLAKITFKSNFIAYVSAFLIAIFPTELLHRSMLGYTDHHILEVVFGLLTVISIIKYDQTKRLLWAVVGGISLAALHYTWPGAPLWGGLLFIWFLGTFFWRYWQHGYNGELKKFSAGIAFCFAIALTLIIPLIPTSQTGVDGILAVYPVMIFIIMGISNYVKPRVGVPSMIGAGIVAVVCVSIFIPSVSNAVIYQLKGVFWGFGSTILEAMPSDLGTIYYFFGIASVFAIVGFIWAIYKKENPLFMFFAIVFIAAMFGQRRWAYVATIPIVILASYGVLKVSSIFTPLIKWVSAFTAVFIIICATIPGQIGMARTSTDITPGWYNACTWLRVNTLDPFSSSIDTASSSGGVLAADNGQIKADYAVLSWWDYGHFIIRIGHRIPMANPAMQINVPAFRFLLAQSDEESEQYEYAEKVKYIMVDNFMISSGNPKTGAGTKFYAMVIQAALPGNPDWRDILPNSLVNRLYQNEETEHYKLIAQFQDVKIFQRKDSQ